MPKPWGFALKSGRRAVHDVVARHHGVVLVDDVVAVERILAEEVAELDVDFDLLAGMKPDNVLSGILDIARLDGDAIARQYPELLIMQVDRVGPAAPTIFDVPDFSATELALGIHDVPIEELTVDAPSAVLAVEVPGALLVDHRVHDRQVAELGDLIGMQAAIRDGLAEVELQERS